MSTDQNPPPPATEGLDDLDLTGTTILIVDDHPQNVELLEAYLEPLACATRTARDGVEALAAVEAELPDLILLDVMMPRMSGFEVCQKLKSDPATRDVPIVMVTALNQVGDRERGLEAGTDEFLSKPFNRIELITRVKSLLKMRMLKKQLVELMGADEVDRQVDLDDATRAEE